MVLRYLNHHVHYIVGAAVNTDLENIHTYTRGFPRPAGGALPAACVEPGATIVTGLRRVFTLIKA